MGFAAPDWAAARGFAAAAVWCTPAGRTTLRRPVPGSAVARAGAIDGSAGMGPTISGVSVGRFRAVGGPAVAWVAWAPARAAAKVGPWPLPPGVLVGWRRVRRGAMDRRRLRRRPLLRRGLEHRRARRRVGKVNRGRGSRRNRRDHHRNRHGWSRGNRSRGQRGCGNRGCRRRCACGGTLRFGRCRLRGRHRPRCRNDCLLDRGNEVLNRGRKQTDRRADSEGQCNLKRQCRADAGHRQRGSGQQARPTTGRILGRGAGPRVDDDRWGTGFFVCRSTIGEVALAFLNTCEAQIFG